MIETKEERQARLVLEGIAKMLVWGFVVVCCLNLATWLWP